MQRSVLAFFGSVMKFSWGTHTHTCTPQPAMAQRGKLPRDENVVYVWRSKDLRMARGRVKLLNCFPFIFLSACTDWNCCVRTGVNKMRELVNLTIHALPPRRPFSRRHYRLKPDIRLMRFTPQSLSFTPIPDPDLTLHFPSSLSSFTLRAFFDFWQFPCVLYSS